MRDGETALRRAGIDSARHDAQRLLAHALRVSWGDLWMRLREPIDRESHDDLQEVVRRRCEGEPLGYILGSVVFCGIEIGCGPGVLVPRPETETLVEVGLGLIADRPAPLVVDIGTGTGAVAIAIAEARSDVHVVATDISEEALSYATPNAGRARVTITVARGDLFDAVDPALRGRIDLVVSNPPYIPDAAVLPPDVAAEPPAALRGGQRGDELLRRIVDGSFDALVPDGALAMEVGTPSQARALEAGMLDGFSAVGVRDDHTDRPRVVWGRR
ncbi:MAG: peptide chain release factor N(5)-glutamine methyltransferase [Actinomycetota bacterium]